MSPCFLPVLLKMTQKMREEVVALLMVLSYCSAAGPDPEWVGSIYSPQRWDPNHLPAAKEISGQCRSSMKLYINALHNGTLWAAKGILADKLRHHNVKTEMRSLQGNLWEVVSSARSWSQACSAYNSVTGATFCWSWRPVFHFQACTYGRG
ncbi:unnamed protein product [Nezara viridula]|uniref:Uncharacterized protein n=1 Tax=Nezara viridula TaxID=85310 RepID=A0A9P0MRF9_NEZVI|nr:unnamed protein product [Nezara viridula]